MKKIIRQIILFFSSTKGGVTDYLDTFALLVVVASLGVGFYETSQNIGDIVEILENAVQQPQSFGVGLGLYAISMDIWTPGLPVSMLPPWLQWISIFYPFAGGYIPHFSIWTCVGALFFMAAVTWITMHVMNWSFWWRGFLVAVVAFVFGWWLVAFIAWHTMTLGGVMIGLTSEQVHSIWSNAVQATSPPLLQYFFILTIPLGALLVAKHVGSRLV